MKFPEQFRIQRPNYESNPGDPYGWFMVDGPCGRRLAILATDGDDTVWNHVSVSIDHKDHTPNWKEMCFVKDLFWEEDETVVQFHPAKKNYVNNHKGCLHLWKSRVGEFPIPPIICV